MKRILLSLFVTSIAISTNAFAEKIVIKGDPVIVEKQGDVYVVPSTVTTTEDYYYFNVNDTRQVCYKTVQPALAKVDLGVMAFKMGDDTVSMHCYTYSPDYFVVP